MPKYTVCLRQTMDKLVDVEVEADTPEDAIKKINRGRTYWDRADWGVMNEVREQEAYVVMDENGEWVWINGGL